MAKYKKCGYLREENECARCNAPKSSAVKYCPKTRSEYRVTQVCWKVPV